MNRAHEIVADPAPDPPEARPGIASWYAPGLSDGLGDRLLMFDNTGASSLELLRFKREFGHQPAFEEALRDRIRQLERFTHPAVAAVRSLDWLRAGEELALVSNHTPGRRLSEALRDAHGASFAIELIRQLSPVLATLQRQGPEVAHGALTLERIIITPEGRLVITEHVLGSALRTLDLPVSRLRSEFGLAAMPAGGRRAVLDGRSDVVQLGLIALSLLVGRRIDPHDHPSRTAALLDEFPWTNPREAGAPALREWLERALQLGGATFASAQDACEALDEWREERLLGPPAARSLEAVPTTMPDFLDDFPSEQDAGVQALRPARPAAPAAPAPVAAPDFPVEFPSEPGRARETPGPKPFAPASKAVALPRSTTEAIASQDPAPARHGAGFAWWIAAAFALVALAEGGAIGGLVYHGLPLTALLPGRETQTSLRPPLGDPPAHTSPDPPKPDAAAGTVAQPTAAAPSAASGVGQLDVTSDPAGARVTIDGAVRGATPLTIQLTPGPHAVTVSDGTTTTRRTVTALAGVASELMAAFSPAAGAAGWVTIHSPLELQIREGGSLLGVTSVDRLMLPAGRHALEVGSAALGFQTTVPVEVQPGKTSTASVAIPNGSLSLNALPWANVTLDGQALAGTTPFANLEVPLGPHEIIWKHPQLGERRETIVVTAKAPVRRILDWKAPIK